MFMFCDYHVNTYGKLLINNDVQLFKQIKKTICSRIIVATTVHKILNTAMSFRCINTRFTRYFEKG